jgi:Pyrimidine dimer DNA glycosylase
MNIFVLSYIIEECARFHCDKHVVKMILESCQLLSTAHHEHPIELWKPKYKSTHKNHPSAKWARESLSNYIWLCQLAKALCIEYTHRYGKIHKCEEYVDELRLNTPDIQDNGLTRFALAMPDYCKCEDAVASYRDYYLIDKYHLLQYKKRERPPWVAEYDNLLEN